MKNRVLILGGTGFVGRILTEKILNSNLDVTLFNRGKRNPGIFPQAKRILGDRETDAIKKIGSDSWDIVVDFSGMQPDNIELITNILQGRAGRYIFISTASVYPLDNPAELKIPIDESAKILDCSDEQRVTKDVISAYGNKKAEMERVLLSKDWLDTIIFRPGLIYGKYDWSDRFYYWLYRAKTQSEILIPEEGQSKSTNTFSEDFANIIFEAFDIKNNHTVYNAVTHPPVSIKEIVQTASRIVKTAPEYITAPLEFLRENNVTEWTDLPVWISGFDLLLDNSRLLSDFKTPLCTFAGSVERAIAYFDSLGWNEGKYGLRVEREKELIDKLLSR